MTDAPTILIIDYSGTLEVWDVSAGSESRGLRTRPVA